MRHISGLLNPTFTSFVALQIPTPPISTESFVALFKPHRLAYNHLLKAGQDRNNDSAPSEDVASAVEIEKGQGREVGVDCTTGRREELQASMENHNVPMRSSRRVLPSIHLPSVLRPSRC